MKSPRWPLPHQPISNSAGFLSADFLFSVVIASGLCVLFFCISVTLSMAEVTQYLAFSVTRAHMAGHKTQNDQEQMAKAKFASFKTNGVLSPLLTNGWFEIKGPDIRGGGTNGRDFGDRYPRGPASQPNIPQVGIRLEFDAKILTGHIPMLGGTDSNVEHKAFVTGMMIREPSAEECFDQIRKQRFKAILELDPRFKTIVGSGSEDKYVGMEDNGC
jgi:hypothetical protein